MNKGDHVGLSSTFEALMKLLKNKIFYKLERTGEELEEVVGGLGKNKLHNSSIGGWAQQIRYFTNSDGSMRFVAGNKQLTRANVILNDHVTITEDMILTGCAAGGSAGTYKLQIKRNDDDSVYVDDIGSGVNVPVSAFGNGTCTVQVCLYKNLELSQDMMFYPMLRAADVVDATFEPYYNKIELGTAAAKDVPSSGNASATQVVMGNDSRLSDARPASDVSSWAKAFTKPSYTYSEISGTPTLGTAAAKDVGTANGVAELDSTGKVPSSQLPSYVDDVLEYASISSFPSSGDTGKIYVAKDTNKTYRWGGSEYVEISASIALGETSSTAYRGDRGKTAYDFSQAPYTSNPAMNGTASAGSSNSWARGDHVHPKDTSKMDVSGGTFTGDIYTQDAYADGNHDFYVEMNDSESVYYMGLRGIIADLNAGLSKRNKIFYGVCSTAASTAAKTVTLDAPNSNYAPVAGDLFVIHFTNSNSASSPTLNINGKGAATWRLNNDSTSYAGGRSLYAYNFIIRYDGTTFYTVATDAPYYAYTCNTAGSANSANSAISADKASALKNYGTSQYMHFHWDGKTSQPNWVWGGTDNDFPEMYVYNPSNFSVASAKTATTASSCSGNAATASAFTFNGTIWSGDLNSYTTNGIYFIRGCNPTHNPSGRSISMGMLLNIEAYCKLQVLFCSFSDTSSSDEELYYRWAWVTGPSNWQSWKKVTLTTA